jgi:single-strand DNA-binding protein
MSRSLNKVMLIGNLTRDPQVRFTPNGQAVANFGLATSRTWMPKDGGEKQEKPTFHNIVAWGKLAEICQKYAHKGDKMYVEGRIESRDWKDKEDKPRTTVEIVAENLMFLGGRGGGERSVEPAPSTTNEVSAPADFAPTDDVVSDVKDISDDIPF